MYLIFVSFCDRFLGAGVAQLVERHLAKVTVESSNLFTRSNFSLSVLVKTTFL